jgi:hypothetical protein
MIRARDGLKMIADAISRKRNPAAVLVPRRLAIALADEMYPPPARHGLDIVDDALDVAMERARDKYIRLVSQGGYIGMLMSVPMVVADDVVVCSLTEQELTDSAGRLGVDMGEVVRDRRRIGAA